MAITCKGHHIYVGRDAFELTVEENVINESHKTLYDSTGNDYDFSAIRLARGVFAPSEEGEKEPSSPNAPIGVDDKGNVNQAATAPTDLSYESFLPALLPECVTPDIITRIHIAQMSSNMIFEDPTVNNLGCSSVGLTDRSERFSSNATSKVLRSVSRFQKEIAYANHANYSTVVLPPLRVLPCSRNGFVPPYRYASLLSTILVDDPDEVPVTFWIPVPLIYNLNGTIIDGLEVWNSLNVLVGHRFLLRALVDIPVGMSLPPSNNPKVDFLENIDDFLIRWKACNTPCFRVHPELLSSTDDCVEYHAVRFFLGYGANCLATFANCVDYYKGEYEYTDPELVAKEKINPKQGPHESLRREVAKICATFRDLDEEENGSFPYHDIPQIPLQPLAWNLDNGSYDSFEQDVVKYRKYREAITLALQDRVEEGLISKTTLMVVGAGRGPLVQLALEAITEMNLPMIDVDSDDSVVGVRVFCIEKNVNALHYLKYRHSIEPLWENVSIIDTDMRRWDTTHRANIMVSELLGSFGDNELSPECLDGAQRFLDPRGVSIPQYVRSTLEPISCHNLYQAVQKRKLECPYNVAAYRYASLVEDTVNVFDFATPNLSLSVGKDGNDLQIDHNGRRAVLEWTATSTGICHGFLGYFHCDLYRDVSISIDPTSISKYDDCGKTFAWFPIYFPFGSPLMVYEGDTITGTMARLSDSTSVWLEWSGDVSCGVTRRLRASCGAVNSNGEQYKIKKR